ncbi:T-cell immunoglobulin and mucin domain-containing protein 4-like isoform X1 [Brienomyrus brachyistius]|uniref:T-cell immunoglobulin and mucin domain-containing protein 4-like isoform X1 n=2 Tax=Brienomyrus brachyistius TaxID=42636 RepID=UPI0020B2CCD5|nr:T-cell immunoglobulin and mucin domain-containing protein 4-like isoform X1 [Brienomyrus brachyistius]
MERLASLILAVAVAGSSALAHKVMEGDQVTLPCRYSVQRYGRSSVCWGRGCGALWCSGAILQMDGSRVVSKTSEKYRLAGNLRLGLVDLTIGNISRADGGPYCCRVDINGYFNDKKVLHTIQVTQAVTPFPAPVGPHGEKSDPYTDRYPDSEPLPLLEEYTLNPRPNHPEVGSTNAEPTPSLPLHVYSPALYLSVSLLFLLLLGLVALLGFKRKLHQRCSFRGSLAGREPRHIIWAIEARRPVEENIYTLD